MNAKIFGLCVILVILFAGCTRMVTDIEVENLPTVTCTSETEHLTITETVPTPTKTQQATSTVTVTPTPTPTKNPVFVEERIKIRELMEKYNYIDSYQLSDEYWEKMGQRIDLYGVANKIVSLEFHGDVYDMYPNYAMTEESFIKQITYLMENDYHFVTIHEIQGFVYGWLNLPARSVILTTDPGRMVWESNERMVENFAELEKIYGYKPHMNTFIVTQGLSEEENYHCKDNRCWLSYTKGVENGYFSLGTHTHWHNRHNEVTEYSAMSDIKMSQEIIFENTGIQVYALSWPYEICSPYSKMLVEELDITIGFGGWSKTTDNYVYILDNQPLCLPRLFPENPNGLSGRPKGMSLAEMLDEAREK
ncbi:polysaccharide deacetylase family protein [Patescibacteria group bacterium]|nr:polysaccharide deacetylase family protein [Patescibacteria group bacterium]